MEHSHSTDPSTGDRLFEARSTYPHPADEVFAWHGRPGALPRLTPPWEKVELVSQEGGIEPGARVELRTRIGPVSMPWVAVHRESPEPNSFADEQVKGPFAKWFHRHLIKEQGEGHSQLVDRIQYRLPFPAPFLPFAASFAKGRVERMFRYRHRILAQDLARHAEFPAGDGRIAISGSTGLVGTALGAFLRTGGHRVTDLVRRTAGAGEVRWDPVGDKTDLAALEGHDAVVHLAGENIAGGRWTKARMRAIEESRIEGTRRLAQALASLEKKPRVFVVASAIGLYGDRPGEHLDEDSSPGNNFLARVAEGWERAADAAREAGIRVVHVRLGIVLTPAGGALKSMLLPFLLGGGGRVGSGEQVWSWISLDDAVAVFHRALMDEAISGPVNAVSPSPVTNAEFTRVLGAVLRRPTFAPLPAFAARTVLGKMADELLLASTAVEPKVLKGRGFRFDHPDLEGALRHLLGRGTPSAPAPVSSRLQGAH